MLQLLPIGARGYFNMHAMYKLLPSSGHCKHACYASICSFCFIHAFIWLLATVIIATACLMFNTCYSIGEFPIRIMYASGLMSQSFVVTCTVKATS